MTLVMFGESEHFSYWYDDARFIAGLRYARILSAACEADWAQLIDLFRVPASAFTAPSSDHSRDSKIRVHVIAPDLTASRVPLGDNFGYSGGQCLIELAALLPLVDPVLDRDALLSAFVAEASELLMDYNDIHGTTHATWHPHNSTGEGLSRVCAAKLHPAGYYSAPGRVVDLESDRLDSHGTIGPWMNAHPRPDFVNHDDATDENAVTYGCATLFLYYLLTQLGHPLSHIIAARGSTLAQKFDALASLEQVGTAWSGFHTLVDTFYPPPSHGGSYQFSNDDIFPLLPPERRSVLLNSSVSVTHRTYAGHHHALISPGVGCAAQDYSYSLHHDELLITLHADCHGFGLLTQKWTINGTEISAEFQDVSCPTRLVTPADPNPDLRTQPLHLDMVRSTSARTWNTAQAAVLTIHVGAPFPGEITFVIEGEFGEQRQVGEPPGPVVPVRTQLTVNTVGWTFEQRYYDDEAECRRAHGNIGQLLFKWNPLFNYLPDPARSMPGAVRVLEQLAASITRREANEPALAKQAAERLEAAFGPVSEVVIARGQRGALNRPADGGG